MSKKRKPSRKKRKPSSDDRISDLPDEILFHILTFLPTKYAFATSVLSKRWTSLYHSLTFIKFDDISVKDHDQFLHFCRSIDAVTLSPHVQQQPLKKFRLNCSRFGNWHTPSVSVWIEAANQRGVDTISLSLNLDPLMPMGDELINLTNVLFNSSNLVVLKLNKLKLSANILSVNLPSLKTLHLTHVYFAEIKDLKKLLSGCPILEELHTNYFRANGFSLRYETSLSKLVRASIRALDVPLKAVYNVKALSILQLDAHDLSHETINCFYKDFPRFENLIHLRIAFQHYDHGWDNVAKVLKHSPNLQTISITKRSSSYFTFRKDWENPNLIPECVSSHLKECKIRNYEGRNGDLQFATYILQNARFLQVMIFKVNSPSYRKSQIIADLSTCPKLSEGCKLLFRFKGEA